MLCCVRKKREMKRETLAKLLNIIVIVVVEGDGVKWSIFLFGGCGLTSTCTLYILFFAIENVRQFR